MERYYGPRQHIPDQIGNRPSRLADNPPDRVQPVTVQLSEASVQVSATATNPNCPTSTTRVTSQWGWGKNAIVRTESQTVITPVVKEPVTPHRTIGVAGGRTIGGGTSKEALRRARRKAPHRP